VYRAQFDKWFASEVEEASATILDGMVADELLYEGEDEDKKVVGVRIRGDEDFYSDIVILATGANSPLTESVVEQIGLKPGKEPQSYALGAKEIIALTKEKIEDRFNLSENEGAALDFIGVPFEGLVGGGFIYTALIPEGGYLAAGELITNGLIITGDSAGFVNMAPLYQEGSNLAMASGKFAGETAILAKEQKDFSKNTLSVYEEKLKHLYRAKKLL